MTDQLGESGRSIMKYTVEKIEEDLDFGCEERTDDMPLQAVVTLSDETGATVIQKFSDAALTGQNIQEGNTVIIDESGELRQALQNDWTKNCSSKTVNIQKFVSMMEAVKAGKEIEWICPFCGGKVKRLEQECGHTVIGCIACDMRINLEQNG